MSVLKAESVCVCVCGSGREREREIKQNDGMVEFKKGLLPSRQPIRTSRMRSYDKDGSRVVENNWLCLG